MKNKSIKIMSIFLMFFTVIAIGLKSFRHGVFKAEGDVRRVLSQTADVSIESKTILSEDQILTIYRKIQP